MKVNKKIILTLFITLLTIFCISGKVEASYSATSKTVKSGANVSITIKSTEKLENFDVAYTDAGGLTYKSCSTSVTGAIANSKNGKISYALYGGQATTLGTYTFIAPKVTEKTKYSVKFIVNDVTVTSTITVEPEKVDNGGSNNNTGSNNGTTNNNTGGNNSTTNNNTGTTTKPATKSTNAYLSTLGITPKEYDFSGFKKTTLTYSVTVPYEVDELKVLYKTAHSGATVKVTGNSGFVVGSNNKITIKVTAEDGKTTKTYTIKVTKLAEEEEKPGNIIEDPEELYLKSLSIKGVELSPEFSKDICAYTAVLSNANATEVEINAEANKEGAVIEVSGNTDLMVGENIINVVVKQENSTMQIVYQITLTKEAALTTTGENTDFMTNLIDNIKNYVIIAVVVVILTIAAIVILIILLRKENKKLKNEETEEYNVYKNDENEFKNNEVKEKTKKTEKEEVTNETETKNVGRRTRRKEKGRHSK